MLDKRLDDKSEGKGAGGSEAASAAVAAFVLVSSSVGGLIGHEIELEAEQNGKSCTLHRMPQVTRGFECRQRMFVDHRGT
jgi:hypothetical protein